jgi:hypothetical protein
MGGDGGQMGDDDTIMVSKSNTTLKEMMLRLPIEHL